MQDGKDLIYGDQTEEQNADQGDDACPGTPSWPGQERPEQQEEYQKAKQIKYEEILKAHATKDSQNNKRE